MKINGYEIKPYANLRGADLRGADLRWANMYEADLRGANLRGADLRGAYLRWAYLREVDLRWAYLREVDLTGADLIGADLRGADLSGVKNIPQHVVDVTSITPEGSFIGWKKCGFGVLVKLRIPENARRSNATGRKCRAEFVEVLEVFNSKCGYGESVRDGGRTRYRVGEMVYADSWDEDRWNECSHGIHFFLTRGEAERY